MDGTPQVVRFDVTTLWHLDAAEWAPSTASIASDRYAARGRGMSASPPEATELMQLRELSRCAITGCEQMQQRSPLFDHPVGAG
jgi:hypothetical protein